MDTDKWKSLTAGILCIVAGTIGIGNSAGCVLIPFIGFFAAAFIALGVIAIIGGIYALMRRLWVLALIGAICAIPLAPPLGIIAVVFLAIGKDEFV